MTEKPEIIAFTVWTEVTSVNKVQDWLKNVLSVASHSVIACSMQKSQILYQKGKVRLLDASEEYKKGVENTLDYERKERSRCKLSTFSSAPPLSPEGCLAELALEKIRKEFPTAYYWLYLPVSEQIHIFQTPESREKALSTIMDLKMDYWMAVTSSERSTFLRPILFRTNVAWVAKTAVVHAPWLFALSTENKDVQHKILDLVLEIPLADKSTEEYWLGKVASRLKTDKLDCSCCIEVKDLPSIDEICRQLTKIPKKFQDWPLLLDQTSETPFSVLLYRGTCSDLVLSPAEFDGFSGLDTPDEETEDGTQANMFPQNPSVKNVIQMLSKVSDFVFNKYKGGTADVDVHRDHIYVGRWSNCDSRAVVYSLIDKGARCVRLQTRRAWHGSCLHCSSWGCGNAHWRACPYPSIGGCLGGFTLHHYG